MKDKTWGGARPGAGRSTLYKGEKKKITLSLTKEALEELKLKAEKVGVSRSDYVNKLIIEDNICDFYLKDADTEPYRSRLLNTLNVDSLPNSGRDKRRFNK